MSKDRSVKSNTVNDVAKLAGVSPATAARVMGKYGSFSEKTKSKVLQAAKELNYFPSAIARDLRSKKSNTIAVVVGSIKNSFFSQIVYEIEKAVAEKNYNVLICDTHEDIEREIKHLENLHSRRVDGIIIAPCYTKDEKIIRKNKYLYSGNIPTVFIDRHIRGTMNDVICTDNVAAAYEATKYLLNLGHRAIGVLSTSNYITVFDRIKGYKKALQEYNIPFDENLIASSSYGDEASSRKATGLLINNNPKMTAIIILNNTLSHGALLELKERNIRFPEDYSIIIWDDENVNELLEITTVIQPVVELGRVAAERIFELIEDSESDKSQQVRVLSNRLIERNSCAKNASFFSDAKPWGWSIELIV